MAANFSVVRNIGLLTGERAVSLVISFFVGVAVMRHLGPENNARLMSMLAVVSLISIFAKLGLDQIVMREAARPGIDSRHVVARFAGMRFLTSLFGSMLLVLLQKLIAPQQVPLAIGFAAILILVQSSDLGLLWCRALGQFKFATTVAITVQFASSLVKLLFVSLQLGYEFFLLAVLAENLVTALCLNTKAFIESAGKPRFPVHEHLTSWAEVSFMTATSAVVVAYFSFDAILLPRLMTLQDAGRFLAARSLTDTATVVGNGLATSLFPILVGLNKNNQASFVRAFSAGLNMASYLGAITAGGVFFGYLIVVEPLLGAKYAGLGSVVLILSLGLVVFFQGSIVDIHLMIKKRADLIMQKAVLALAIKAALILLLRASLTLEFWAVTTILSAYFATLFTTYVSVREVFWAQIASLDPRHLPQSWRTIRSLA